MKSTHFDDIKNQIDVKEAEISLLKDELTDTLTPSVKTLECIEIVIGMICDLNLYIQKNGNNDAALKSKERLTKLFSNLHDLSSIAETNYSLKLTNRNLHTQNNLVRVENNNLNKELKNLKLAFEGL